METAQQRLNKCPLRYGCDFKYVNFKHRLEMDILSIWINITLECIPKYFENKTLVHVMAYCHYLNDVDLDLCRHIVSLGHNELINLWFVAFYWHNSNTLQWRHNGHDSVSNHQPRDCLLNRLFRRQSKKTSKLRVIGLCVGNSPGTDEFSAQMASNAENVSIWWRHHEMFATILVICVTVLKGHSIDFLS